MLQHATDRSVHLWHAAEAICILHTRVVLAVRFANLRTFKQGNQVLRCSDLSRVGTRLVNPRIESRRRSHQRFQRHGSSYVCQLCNSDAAGDCQTANGRHRLCAVQQRKALFGSESQRLQPCTPQRFATCYAFPFVERLAFADGNQRKVSQWRQIPACAYGAFFRNDRMDAGIQKRNEQITS